MPFQILKGNPEPVLPQPDESSPRRIGRDGVTPLCVLREGESAYLSTAEDMRDVLNLKIYKIDRQVSPVKKSKASPTRQLLGENFLAQEEKLQRTRKLRTKDILSDAESSVNTNKIGEAFRKMKQIKKQRPHTAHVL